MTLSATGDSVEDRPLGKKSIAPSLPDSVWLTEALPATPALRGHVRADIAVVGGGITGLSAAYHFRQRYPNKQIVILEGQRIGFGASGRNSGFISQEYHGWDSLFFSKGAAAVAPYAEYAERGYRHLVETIAREAIDCDLQESGALRLAKKDAEVRTLEKQVPAYAQLGRSVELWQGKDLAARIGSDFYPAGVFLPHWATLHPGKLVRGLSSAVEALGVHIYEHTPVQQLRRGKPVELVCPDGQLSADTVVVATNAYTPQLGLFRHILMPLHLYVMVTQPVDEAVIGHGAWTSVPGRYEMDATHTIRLTPDGRLLIRGGARYDYNSRVADRHQPRAYRRLAERLLARYPYLGSVRAAHGWSGVMALTRAHTPLLGRLDNDPRVLFSVGYNGFGLVSGFYGGRLVCELYANQPNPDLALMSSPAKAGWLPPEPLRYVHMNVSLALRHHRL